MAYAEPTRRSVRASYISGLPLNAAAAAHNVPYQTARGWKAKAVDQGDNWDDARAANRISGAGVKALTATVIEDFVHLFQATIAELKGNKKLGALDKAEALARLSDAYAKTIKAAGASNPELSKLAIAMDVLKLFSEFLRDNHPDLLSHFMSVLEPFGEELSRSYG